MQKPPRGEAVKAHRSGKPNQLGFDVEPPSRIATSNFSSVAGETTVAREMTGAPFGMIREVLLSPIGLPCNPPPWGALSAIDLNSWKICGRRRSAPSKR